MNHLDSKLELTIHLEGTLQDEGNLRLGIFASKLQEFRTLYDEAKNLIEKDNARDDLLIINLAHNSPTATTLQPKGIVGARALDFIVETINSVNSKIYILANDQLEFFEKLSNFCRSNFNSFGSIKFSSNGIFLTSVTTETVEFIDSLLLPDYTSLGEVKGIVEGYFSHPKRKYFYIYPAMGGRVKCNFNESNRPQARNAVDRNIIVSGILKYYGGNFFPYEIDVNEIEIIDFDEDLPLLSQLRKDGNNAMNSVEIIKRIRNEW